MIHIFLDSSAKFATKKGILLHKHKKTEIISDYMTKHSHFCIFMNEVKDLLHKAPSDYEIMVRLF